AEDGIRDRNVTGVQTCALPICTRNISGLDFSEITTDSPEKTLLRPLVKPAGRNSQGRITTRHKGSGHRRQYRLIDFKRDKDGIPGRVVTIEYDPNRSANIALI